MTGGTKLCSIDKLNAETKWESLDSRRRKHKLILFYKMKNNMTPVYLTNLIPDQTQHRYRLRNDNDIPLIHARTNLYQNSFLPSTIREWNSLPADVRHSETLPSFKYKLNKNLRKPPSYYSSGDRLGQVLLTRIRLGLQQS